MAVEGETVETPSGDVPAEGTPAEGEELTPVEGAEGTPADGEGEKTPEQVAAEAAAAEEAAKAKPASAAEAFAALPEPEQRKIAEKFANKTMAAARRSEARVEAAKAENVKLSSDLGTYREFVQQLASGDPAALARVGFKSPRDYLDKVVAFGGEKPAPTADDRVAAIEKRLEDEKAAAKAEQVKAKIEESKTAIFKAVGERPDLPWLSTKLGRTELWSAVETYFDEHKECPDEAVWVIAEELQREMTADLGPASSKKVSGQGQPAKNGTASGAANPGTLNPGKTLTSKGSSGAPSVKELSLDPDERRRQVNEQLRAEGLI